MATTHRRTSEWLVRGVHRALWPSILTGVALLITPARATDWKSVQLKCPIDGTRFEATVVSSLFLSDYSSDLRPLGVGVDQFLESIASCPTCGFSADYRRFKEPGNLDVEKVKRALAKLRTTRLFRKLDAAFVVERFWTNDPQALADLALGAKWRADDTGEEKTIRGRTKAAIEAIEAAWNSATARTGDSDQDSDGADGGADSMVPDDSTVEADDDDREQGEAPADLRPRNAYLAGELHRQVGNRDLAMSWFDRALASVDSKQEGLRDRMVEQMFLLRNASASVEKIIAEARRGSDAERLGAIDLLRVSEAALATRFLEEYCPKSEQAMARLAGYVWATGFSPSRAHGSIYLQALDSDDPRIVNLALHAIERLHLTEAAPRIAKDISNRNWYGQRASLSTIRGLATPREVPELAALVGTRSWTRSSHGVYLLEALLHTRSPDAVPAIIELVSSFPEAPQQDYEAGEDHDLERAAAEFGPSLLDALPSDHDSRGPESVLVVWTVRILGHLGSKVSHAALIRRYEEGGPLALEAAISLLRRGDPRGKGIVLKDVRGIRDRWRSELDLLVPFLEPTDFDLISEQMKTIRERREPDAEEPAWELDHTFCDLIRLLGATRDARAKDVVVSYLDRTRSPSVRLAAIEGLGYVYDDHVAGRFREMLRDPSTDFATVNAILHVIGRVKDVRQIDLLLALIEEPSPVETKEAWTVAIENLAPERGVPIWRAWCGSPRQDLKALARRALGAEDGPSGRH